ncbi:MAG: flagellar biosynthesis anti-sigma factor FlgM [Deltaproteobacteria bacterium]
MTNYPLRLPDHVMAEARALAEGGASVDQAKVERLRQSIQSGSLRFDSQLVAQRLVDQDE